MLPIETFADVISFLGYYDLGGLKLANKPFSDVANQCADRIRLFDFSNFGFNIYDSGIDILWIDSDGEDGLPVCWLDLTSKEGLAGFISAAFRNCTLGRLAVMGDLLSGRRRRHVLRASQILASQIQSPSPVCWMSSSKTSKTWTRFWNLPELFVEWRYESRTEAFPPFPNQFPGVPDFMLNCWNARDSATSLSQVVTHNLPSKHDTEMKPSTWIILFR